MTAARPLDSFDRRILAELQVQGDLGPAELSERVNLSASQCSRRLQRLKAEGYIARTVALLSHDHLSLGVSAYVLVTLRSHDPERIEAFQKLVRTNAEILECASTTGEADFVLRVCTRDLDSYNAFLTQKLLLSTEVAKASTSIVLHQYKDTTELPLDFLG
jgi:Lrp/AsnC family leucine-responsive transcriptional regulator